MSISETLTNDMKAAMRAGEKLELGAIRMALAAIKSAEIEARASLSDDAIIGIIGKLIKQGKDAEQQFESGGRDELAAKEAAEVTVLQRYMPLALSDEETEALIRQAIDATGATEIKDMGKVMAAIKSEGAGRVDMGTVSGRVREILTAS